jgi:hypothetical protein
MTDPRELLMPRATAEFGSRRYRAAVKSLEICLREKVGNEALITGALARCHRALGGRQDAITWYRRAVQVSGIDPTLLSEFLRLVVEEQGVNGLLRELPAYDQVWQRLDIRLNATLSCFTSWAAVATGDEKEAFEKLVLAVPYISLASQQPTFGGDEALVCGVIQHVVAEKLGDSKHLAGATVFLKQFPGERVRAMREEFLLPKR